MEMLRGSAFYVEALWYGDSQRFHVFPGSSALSRNSSTNQGRIGQNSIKTTRIDLKLCRQVLGSVEKISSRHQHPISSLSMANQRRMKNTSS
jgi:hypothetical protein